MERKHGKKHFKSIRKNLKSIFQSGGTLREYLLYIEWMKKKRLMRLADFLDMPLRTRQLHNRFVHKKAKTFEIIKDSKQQIHHHGADISQNDVFTFYVELLQEALPFLNASSPPSKWHLMRKKYKRVLYARHWQDGSGLRLLSNRQAKYLDDLQHHIGDWNDTAEMKAWFTEQLQKCRKKIDDKNTAAFDRLYNRSIRYLDRSEKRFKQRVVDKLARVERIMRPMVARLERAKAKGPQ